MKANYTKILVFIFLLIEVKCQPDQFKGEFEVYKTSNGAISSQKYSNHHFSDTWSIIKQFKYSNDSYFLFYDKSKGQIEILDASFHSMKSLTGFRKNLTIINPIDIDSDGNDELFLYNPGEIFGIPNNRGTGEFYSVNNQFQLNLLNTDSTYRNYWRDIIACDFDSDGKKELLFYDPTNTYPDSCSAEMYSVNNNCLLTLINNFSWNKIWKIMTPVKIGTSTGLLRYEGVNGTIELLGYSPVDKTFSIISVSNGNSLEIDKIIPGNFGITRNSDLLFYEKSSGGGTFYSIINNTLQKTGENSTYRKTWEIILPFEKYNATNDYLIFYQRQYDTELSIQTYDDSGQAVHPDILKLNENEYRLVFTPYPWNIDTLEDPSILESIDGINFHKIPDAKNNPLVYRPEYNGYERGHNDDPDYYKEKNDEYIIYQETFQLAGSNPRILDQNIVLLNSSDSWATFNRHNILVERNTKNPYSFSVSPALVKKDSIYYLFYVNCTFNGVNPLTGKIQFLTSNNIYDWNFKSDPTEGYDIILNSTIKIYPWHIDVVLNPYDRNYYMLISGKTDKFSSGNNSLYLAKSSDLVNWELCPKPIIIKEEIRNANMIYRSSGIFRDFNILDIYYSYEASNRFLHINFKKNFFITNKSWHINLRKNYSIRDSFYSNNYLFK